MKKTKLIPFTIEAWKAGGKPVTRDGCEVNQLTHFESKSDKYCLYGTIDWEIFIWQINGRYNAIVTEGNYDLMLEVEDTEKELYLVVMQSLTCGIIKNGYNLYVSDDIEYSVKQPNYLTHLKLPPCNS